MTNHRGSKLALLHRVKERTSLSLSAQASGYTLFPEGGVVLKIPYCEDVAPARVEVSGRVAALIKLDSS